MEVNKYFIQNFIARVCFLTSAFFVNILFANLLTASGSGEFYYTINNFSLATLLASFSLESGNTYFLSKKEISDNELITFSLIWTLFAASIATAILTIPRDSYFLTTKYNLTAYSFVFIAGSLLTTYFSSLFFARRNFVFPHLIPAITNFLVILLGVWFFITKESNRGIHIILTSYFAGFIANGIILGILYRSKYPSSFLLSWPTKTNVRRLLRYCSLAFVTNIVAFLAFRIDYWILKKFSPDVITDVALGNYIQVSKLMQLFLIAPTIVGTIVFPVSASGVQPKFDRHFRNMFNRVLLLNIVGCGFVLLIGNWGFTLVYGKSFWMMYNCFMFSVPAILAITVVRILSSYFAGTNRIRYNLFGSLLALTVIGSLNYLLVPLMGINGAALADSAGYSSYMIFLLILFTRKK